MAARVIPTVTRKWSVTTLINNFREACSLIESPLPEVGPTQVLIRNKFVGVNASDINVAAGRYDPAAKPPFDIGFEGVGEVIQVGAECQRIEAGQAIAHTIMGAFSEYQVIPECAAIKVPAVKPEYVCLLISGLGVSTGLEVVGELKPTDTVLVTGATGGAGQVAVQYAKAVGCHVIGTYSGNKKEFLKSLGCDRPIDYKNESLHDVLSTEYKNGVDVIFENIGGAMLVQGVNNIAVNGRVVLFGTMSSYSDKDMKSAVFPDLKVLMLRSASLRGHLFYNQKERFQEFMSKMLCMVGSGKLRLSTDDGSKSPDGAFRGLEDVPRAIEYLYKGQHTGKVYVELPDKE